MRRLPSLVICAALFGYAFLYLPIAILVGWSFNESRLVAVWGGFSLKWYGELARNEQILSAAGLSVTIAAASATIAAVLGTLAALGLSRLGRYRGRGLLGALLLVPLVLPEVIAGLSLLLLFVSLEDLVGWPAGRGATTVIIAHATMTTAYAAVVVRARLGRLDPALEEAAADLGARPATVFRTVVLPLLAPAIAAAWLLAFTLSLDDLVIASFVSGPGASTLPMVVFSSVRLGVSPQINALATILIAVVAMFLAATWLLMRRRDRGGI